MIEIFSIFSGQLDFVQKDVSEFRDYTIDDKDPVKERVRRTYRLMHLNQTVDYVKSELKNIFLKIKQKRHLLHPCVLGTFIDARRH